MKLLWAPARQEEPTDIIPERSAGIDVHQATVTACLRWPGPTRTHTQAVQIFGTTTPDFRALRNWLTTHQVTHAAMESTGVYRKPVDSALDDGCTRLLVNAAHLAKVPGRKTDVADCAWIAQLLECGPLRGNCVPSPPIRKLRDLTRDRKALLQDRTWEANRLHKILEDAGFKLATVATDILGVSGRAKFPALRQALTGRFHGHHAFLVTQLFTHLDYLDETIATRSEEMECPRRPFTPAGIRLQTIPRVKQRTVENLLAEIGVVMVPFPTASHLTSWAGLCPGNNESAGKQRRGCTRKWDRWLKITLLEAALAAIRVKDAALGARYRRICQHRGRKSAIVAVARAIPEIVSRFLTTGATHHKLGAAYLDHRDKEQAARRYVRLLENLGHRLTMKPTPIAA